MSANILIVDDSPTIRQFVEATLVSEGHNITAATNGAEALEQCKYRKFDFVLTDQNMPQMDGITLIKNLRGMAAYQSTPIVVLTTEVGDDIKSQGKAAGATGWMVKPFDPKNLVEVTRRVLN